MIIEYETSVFLPNGRMWRPVTVRAEAEPNRTGKMASVKKVLTIDGKEPVGWQSRTGARRQQFHAPGIAAREVGKNKRVSACRVVEHEAV